MAIITAKLPSIHPMHWVVWARFFAFRSFWHTHGEPRQPLADPVCHQRLIPVRSITVSQGHSILCYTVCNTTTTHIHSHYIMAKDSTEF